MRKLHSNRVMVIANLREISNNVIYTLTIFLRFDGKGGGVFICCSTEISGTGRFFIVCKMSMNSCSNPLFSVPIANSNHKLRTKFKIEF